MYYFSISNFAARRYRLRAALMASFADFATTMTVLQYAGLVNEP